MNTDTQSMLNEIVFQGRGFRFNGISYKVADSLSLADRREMFNILMRCCRSHQEVVEELVLAAGRPETAHMFESRVGQSVNAR